MWIKASVVVGCLSCVVSVVGSGCAYGEARQVVRAQFASELSCPEVQIESRKVFDEGYKEGQFITRGCGVTRTYTCPPDSGLIEYGDDKVCSFVNGDMTVPKQAPKPQSLDEEDGAGGDDMMDEPPAAEPEASKPAAKPAVKASPFKASGNFKVGK